MEEKQTAIEWLVKQCFPIMQNTPPLDTIIEQAKQIEKEQIEIAFAKSYLIGLAEVNYDEVNKASEQYYSETYGK